MDDPLLALGVLVCAGATAAGLLPLERRPRLVVLTIALFLAPVLIAGDNWDSDRFVDLRDSPLMLAAAAVVATAGVAALARLLLARPRWLSLLLIAALPFRIPIDLGGSSANLLLPLYGILAAALLAAWMRPERILPVAPPAQGLLRLLGPALALVLVVYGLQAAYAGDISTAVENVSFFYAPFALVFVILSGSGWDRSLLRAAVLVLALEGLLFALVGFGQTLTGELLWNEKVIDGNEAHAYFRVNSLFFDPNIMGRYLAVTMVVLAAVAAWGRSVDARRAALLFVVLLGALVITFSQTSMLALLAGLGVLVAAAWGIPRALLAGAAVVATLALAVFALGGGGLTAETTGRTGLVSGGLEIAADRPLQGYGSGTFADRFVDRFGAGDGIAVESHTEPVTVAAEQGLIGLIPYALLLGLATVALWRAAGIGSGPARAPLAATLLAVFAAMVVHSLGYGAFLTDPITWSLFALAATLPAAAVAPERVPAPGTAARAPTPEPT